MTEAKAPKPNAGASRDIIFTNHARCRDCNRCVRVCPVKSIQVRDGQAHVVPESCILCGNCVRECPQHAKTVRSDVDEVIQWLAAGEPVAVSIAPSFAAAYPGWRAKRLCSALRRLGFKYVGETALGASYVATQLAAQASIPGAKPTFFSSCPALVRYVEIYWPDLLPRMSTSVSPMVAHARHIKRNFGEHCKVVFIGPCIAKKFEAQRVQLEGVVDSVLTFMELDDWLTKAGIELAECEESHFDEAVGPEVRLYALEGGALKSSNLSTDIFSDHCAVSGFDGVREACEELVKGRGPKVIEGLMCQGGCICGPAMLGDSTRLERRDEVLRYSREAMGGREAKSHLINLTTQFEAQKGRYHATPSESEIRHILEVTGKVREEDQLNCGACGYSSCREKAIAVFAGLAEPEMCIPHMRALAEQRTDRIITTSPNGIVILNEQLHILHLNPAFCRMFACSNSARGKPISHLMDPAPFERLLIGTEPMVRMTAEHPRFKLVCHQIMYTLPEERQFVGLFVNITESYRNQEELDTLKGKTVAQAKELLNQQLSMAETVARTLGESTAKTEALIEKLMELTRSNK